MGLLPSNRGGSVLQGRKGFGLTTPRRRASGRDPWPGTAIRRARAAGLLLVAALVGMLSPAAASDAQQTYDKAYLLADTGDYLWWSVDPAEDGANLRLVERRCPELPWGPGTKPCLLGAAGPETRTFSLWFHQVARVDEVVGWDAASPLRFRFGLVVDPPVPNPTVQLAFTNGGPLLTSAPATQVSPGVWEGTLADAGSLGPGKRGQFGVRVSYPGAGAPILKLRTDGSSWIEFPRPILARSLNELKSASPDAANPQSVQTGRKTFRFNDGDWELQSFTGDLAETRSYTVNLARPAAAVLGWIETGKDPLVQHVAGGGAADTTPSGPYGRTNLVKSGKVLGRGAGSDDMGDTATTHNVGAGPLELLIETSGEAGSDPYQAHVLVVYGQRTLQSYRTRFSIPSLTGRVLVTATCPSAREAVPVTAAVSAFRIELDWDSVLPNQRWVPRYTLPEGDYPCAESGTGDAVTFVNIPFGEFWFGATPSKDTVMASYRDTVIDAHVRFWYVPASAP